MLSDAERRERFVEVYAGCVRDVTAYALRRCGDRNVAAEVAAETFTVVWRRMDDLPDGDSTRPWVFGVARRVLANHGRTVRRRDRLIARVAAVASWSPVTAAERDESVDAALARLSDSDAELLRLSYWEGLRPAELAVMLGIGASTVRSQLTRARQRFAASTRPSRAAQPTSLTGAGTRSAPGSIRVGTCLSRR
jgi:RNA polymerase sigma-70 factor (ECF subfamily)